jgi:hypothetical protein
MREGIKGVVGGVGDDTDQRDRWCGVAQSRVGVPTTHELAGLTVQHPRTGSVCFFVPLFWELRALVVAIWLLD